MIKPIVIITFLTGLGAFLFQDLNIYIGLLNNFQLTLFYIVIILSVSVFTRSRKFSIIMIMLATICMSSFIGYFYEKDNVIGGTKLFYMNQYVKNNDVNTVSIGNNIQNGNYDYVALVETNDKMISLLSQTYGEPKVLKKEDCSFWTKNSIKNNEIKTAGGFTYCKIKLNDDTDVFIVHPFAGYTTDLIMRQKAFYMALRADIDNSKRFIVVGDFNNTIFNSSFRGYFGEYIKKSFVTWQYQNYENNFMKQIVTSILRLPIDFAFSNIDTFGISKYGFLYSDHEPIVVNF